ncbi:hypothetical protein D3C76_998520 [compost metagenome]
MAFGQEAVLLRPPLQDIQRAFPMLHRLDALSVQAFVQSLNYCKVLLIAPLALIHLDRFPAPALT